MMFKQIKRSVWFISMSLSLSLNAQTYISPKGIKWIDGLSWQEIKHKAFKENKFIFIDAYATWCGPCKKMDREVYVNDTIGNFFNSHFIAVKLQMDKTNKDNASIRNWYDEATAFSKQYRILSYPSYIFFSPQGVRVHQAQGFMEVPMFLSLGQEAILPGKTYKDPYVEYDNFVARYNEGIQDYEGMPKMITIAAQIGEKEFEHKLLNEHTDYIAKLSPRKRYTKENIELWSRYLLNSNGKRFQFFFKDGAKIDKIMMEKGFAASIVDRTIEKEIIIPFFKEEPNGGRMLANDNMMFIGATESKKIDYSEADWKKLYRKIRTKINDYYARRGVLNAKVDWYQRHNNFSAFAKVYSEKLQKYGWKSDAKRGALNSHAWKIFLNVTEQSRLNDMIDIIYRSLQQNPKFLEWPAGLDTYANLLYKVGRKKEAIEWQEKAKLASVKLGKSDSKIRAFSEVLEQMKRNEPTYLESGAVWQDILWVNWEQFEFNKVLKVVNVDGQPISGVEITNTRSGQKVYTLEKGYSRSKVRVGDRLLISHEGYTSQNLSVKKDATLVTLVLKK